MPDPPGHRRPFPYLVAAIAYASLTVAAAWPLPGQMAGALGGDLGDSLFSAWVIGWVGDHLGLVLRGELGAWTDMWQAPIFAPSTDALTYSENFLAQSAQALPVLLLTGNRLLAFNVVLLSTLALTALAAHRLAYHLAGSHVTGVVAGLLCAFNDYRLVLSVGHLHVLSTQWWLMALWCLDAFVATGSRAAWLGLACGLVMTDLSSMYLMAYTAPFTGAFALWSLIRHGRGADLRRWLGVAAAGAVSILVMAPVLSRYLAMREAQQVTRTVAEVVANSATIAAYAISAPWLVPMVALAVVGVMTPRRHHGDPSVAAKAGLLGMAVAAALLSLGPVIAIGGTSVPGPYGMLEQLPGYAGLRAPSRFAAILLVFVPVLAGLGAAWLVARWRITIAVVGVVVVLGTRAAWSVPFPVNAPLASSALAPPPSYLMPAAEAPAIYRAVQALPADATLIELPFGDVPYEIRYTYFTGAHRHRVVNGYSGVLPRAWHDRAVVLRTPLADEDASWQRLAPATHALVHTNAWPDDTGARVQAWLEGRGARVVAAMEGAALYSLPPR